MNFEWPFPKKFSTTYRMASAVVLGMVGGTSKIWLTWFNRPQVFNLEVLTRHLADANRPVITVCNHLSCMDDPLVWGALSWKQLVWNVGKMRWTLAAHDIVFTRWIYVKFFSLGKCVPIVRGDGVYQKGVDFCVERLNNNEWVHMFPEGKVNLNKEPIRFKWGVGRMIADAKTTPIVIPFWHVGLDEILPNEKPYIPRIGKKATIFFGDSLQFDQLLTELRKKGATAEEIRKEVTDVIQRELYSLKEKAEKLHQQYLAGGNSKTLTQRQEL